MTAGTELDDVMVLLEKVFADPAGYGRRLVQQFVLQWASAAPTSRTVVEGETADTETPDSETTDPPTPDSTSGAGVALTGDMPSLLASALGACNCWGEGSHCPACHGAGSPGWAIPDPDLFQTYVAPAAARLTSLWATDTHDDEDDLEDHLEDHHHPRPREGVRA